MEDLAKFDIKTYPTAVSSEREVTSHLERYMPFAVIGSEQFHDSNGKVVRGRKYRWGVAEGKLF